ncbi:MAG: beta-ketoacyl-ACP synthase I [Alphaproteobacteria bacterium]|jgi:3-oxoacyl-[acyl-carrier-protein] synthase-1|nr:beta-ketoacyl-ACP synthase I [Alphaproteobacteria bacterium]MDP6815169.1 beta-ketoacyl-ACP synthase I [Alphaproteobacteria bacterium]
MRRVVITGMGIVSSIGNNKEDVGQALRDGRSGIEFAPKYQELSFRSQVQGSIKLDLAEHIDRKALRFMGPGAAYNYLAMEQAIEDSGLGEDEVSDERAGIIVGSGGPSTSNQVWAADTAREKGAKRIGPYMVTRCMSSTNSAVLATLFKIKGVNYSIVSACATSAHCIGNAAEMIQFGKQDVMFAGGGEELDWTLSVLFDGMGAMSSKFNDSPERASRPYDVDRDGFVISGGGGMLVLEELEHAKARGARIYAELTGYGATSDGHDMVQPSGDGAVRCMRQALGTANRPIGYVNAHGTGTPIGDPPEVQALRDVFGADLPPIASTKSLTGHALGAAGVNEAIYSLIMMEGDFIAASANVENLDPEFEGVPIVRERIDDAGLTSVMSNSFGFGGTNATLIFDRYDA